MNEKRIVNGEVFIIPIQAGTLRDLCSPEWEKEKINRFTGLEVQNDEKLIQVWVTGPKCDNWSDTFNGFQKEAGVRELERGEKDDCLLGYFPLYLPSRIFEGKHEEDSVEFYCPEYGVRINLTCHQTNHRYRFVGRFEEAYKKVLHLC